MARYIYLIILSVLLCSLLGLSKLAFVAFALIDFSYAIYPIGMLLMLFVFVFALRKQYPNFQYIVLQTSTLPLLSLVSENPLLKTSYGSGIFFYNPLLLLGAILLTGLIFLSYEKKYMMQLYSVLSLAFLMIFVLHTCGIV